jgi:hypothetical protein
MGVSLVSSFPLSMRSAGCLMQKMTPNNHCECADVEANQTGGLYPCGHHMLEAEITQFRSYKRIVCKRLTVNRSLVRLLCVPVAS